ncbi:MAG TPA: Flp family type IVb pilin [Streptosporangiaceae bacterium]|nr:Flp family type IVb pilin [Streptosporangiaceae bacterium]
MPDSIASARSLIYRLRFADDRGVSSIEYAILASLIAVIISGAVGVLGMNVNALFGQILGAF